MARYGMDYGRDYDRWGGQGWSGSDRGYGEGGWSGNRGGPYGGMRPESGNPNWRELPSDQSGYGSGFGGYDAGYGGSSREWGGSSLGGRFFGGGGGYGGDFTAGGYGGRDSGYGSRDTGYGGGMGGGYGMQQSGGGWRQGGGQSRVRAADLMTENPECVTPDATLADVARKMRDLDVGIIPVVDGMESRRLRGVITDRDITVRAVAEGKDGKAKVSECMTTDVETVNKNDSAMQVMNLMSREQVRRVPVTDREGRLVGIIAQADLALDYGEGNPSQERHVEETIERISEPGSQRGAMAARGRGEGGGRQSSE